MSKTKPLYFIVPESTREPVPGWHNFLRKKATIRYLPFREAGARGWELVIRLKINRGNRFRKLKYLQVAKMVNRGQNNTPECIQEVNQ
jgi:hypothetical protein